MAAPDDDDPLTSRRTFLDASLTGVAGMMMGATGRADDQSPAAVRSAESTEALAFLDIDAVSALVRLKKVSPVELTRICLARIEAQNPTLKAFITVTAESAVLDAQRAEAEIQQGQWRGPLHGIPIGLKDLIDTAGVRTTSGSALFEHRVPTEDATVVRHLREAGAVFLGKLNMQEFAYGGTSVPSHFGAVANPWDPQRIAGGSSGGPAAAVAAGLCYAALGSDTGGSIREPAAFCGIVGFKPTYGRVSNHGVVPLSWSLDHLGPMTRSVADAAIVLQSIVGYDPQDTASQDRPAERYLEGTKLPHGRFRLGVPRAFFFADLDPEVRAAVERAIAVLVSLGGEVRDVALETNTDRTVFRAEGYAVHADSLAKTPELYLPETRGKLKLGAAIDAPAYIRARRELDRIRRSMADVFSAVDFIVTPTSPVIPPKLSDYPGTVDGALALDGLVLRNTRAFNLYGIPAISIPCGMTAAGLPIGLQIAGPAWQEARVLRLTRAFEAATEWHVKRPPAIALR